MGSASDTLPAEHPEIEVWAAGGVIWRRGDVGVELLLAHRPGHRDRTFPKGKLDPGETLRQCARREVEETGDGIHSATFSSLELLDDSVTV